MDEPALVRQARAGDLLAFEELVAPHRAGLHAHCYRMLASAHDADDALQDALIGYRRRRHGALYAAVGRDGAARSGAAVSAKSRVGAPARPLRSPVGLLVELTAESG
ncbi:MAG: hypothetical protein WBL05_01280 [Brooklawnia sp.]|uniref:hypothetical protein n=1 Tax=Brooklawnia sp. TaxID=2699740 RepID=UPI003C72CA7B